MDDLFGLTKQAIDLAFSKNIFSLNLYQYAKSSNMTRRDMIVFIESSVARELAELVVELDDYLIGGNKSLREAYGYIPKPKARKIRNYLYGILEDAKRYEQDRRPGRKKKS